MKEKLYGVTTFMKTCFRWILVIPTAFGAWFAIQFFVGLLWRISSASIGATGAELFHWWIEIVQSSIGGYCFIRTGIYVAPRLKPATSVVLVLFLTSVNSYMVGFLAGSGIPNWRHFTWIVTLATVTVISSVLTCGDVLNTEWQFKKLIEDPSIAHEE